MLAGNINRQLYIVSYQVRLRKHFPFKLTPSLKTIEADLKKDNYNAAKIEST